MQQQAVVVLFRIFAFWSFEFVSDFEISASDLVAAKGRDVSSLAKYTSEIRATSGAITASPACKDCLALLQPFRTPCI